MKMTTVGIVTRINKDEMNELLKETKETLATGALAGFTSGQKFGSVDLWKIRRNNKTTSMRRRFI